MHKSEDKLSDIGIWSSPRLEVKIWRKGRGYVESAREVKELCKMKAISVGVSLITKKKKKTALDYWGDSNIDECLSLDFQW